jgi:hypothetical protein
MILVHTSFLWHDRDTISDIDPIDDRNIIDDKDDIWVLYNDIHDIDTIDNIDTIVI